MKLLKVICLTALVVMTGSAEIMAAGSSNVTDYEVQGHPAPAAGTGCVESAKLVNTNTPVDLYLGLAACIKADNYRDGAFLFALAGVYGLFDIKRVEDRTGHQAIIVMQMGVLGALDETGREKLSAEANKMLDNPDNLRVTCNEMERIGAPAYHPSYMINHGLKAFTGGVGKNGLVENFDARSAWLKALDSYLHCPEK